MAITPGFRFLPQTRDTSAQSRLAQAILSRPIGGPVRHPVEGASKLAETLVSALLLKRGQKIESKQREKDIEQMFDLMERQREFEATPTSREQELSDMLLGVPGQQGVALPGGQPDLPERTGLIEGIEDLPAGVADILRVKAKDDPQSVLDDVLKFVTEKPEAPETREVKRGDQIITQEWVAGTGWVDREEAPRFQERAIDLMTLRFPDDSVKTFDTRDDAAIKQALAEGAVEAADEDQPARLQLITFAQDKLDMSLQEASRWSKEASQRTDQQLRDDIFIAALKTTFGSDPEEARRITEEAMAFLRPPKPEEPVESIATEIPIVGERGAEAAPTGATEVVMPVPKLGQVTGQAPAGLPEDIKARVDSGENIPEEELVKMFRDQPEVFKALRLYLDLINPK